MPRLRPTPWLVAAQAAYVASQHWTQNLTTEERARLRTLLTRSKGLPRNLTAGERTEIKGLVSQLDVLGAGRKLLPLAGKRGARKRS